MQRYLNRRCLHRHLDHTDLPRGRRIGRIPAPKALPDLRPVETPLGAPTSPGGEPAYPDTATGRADASPTSEEGTGLTRATETGRTLGTMPHLQDRPDIAGKEVEEVKAVAAIATTTSR